MVRYMITGIPRIELWFQDKMNKMLVLVGSILNTPDDTDPYPHSGVLWVAHNDPHIDCHFGPTKQRGQHGDFFLVGRMLTHPL